MSDGLVIDITYDSSVDSAPAAFKTVIASVVQYYESVFTNPITLNIDVGYGEINGQSVGAGDLGESEGLTQTFTYAQIKQALITNATSPDQLQAVSTLPSTSPAGGSFTIPLAEATALGLISGGTTFDGYVGFSSTASFAYSDGNGVAAGEYDFYGDVAHEFSEVMGRVSDIGTGSTSILDLFRYSAAGDRALSFRETTAYFSINGGVTDLGNFNTDPEGDFGDWASSMGNDAYDAFSNSGVANRVSQADLTVMNILGYGLASTQTLPPVLSGGGNDVDYTLEGPAVAIDAELGVSGASSATLTEATVDIGAGFLAGDTLNFTSQPGIAGSYNATMGVLTLTGSASVANYQAALESVGFSSSGSNPSDSGTDLSRSVSWTVMAGTQSSNTITSTIDFGQTVNPIIAGGSPDFTGDGMSDILWQNTNGTVADWLMNTSTITSAADIATVAPGSGWSIAGVGDFTGNGMSDILWQNTNGTVADWLMNASTITSVADIATVDPGAGWSIVGIGDFTGDGMSDILWQNTNGTVADWLMNGSKITAAADIATVARGSGWSIVGIGDFTGNGLSDILWQNTNGTVADWTMNGSTVTSAADIATVAPGSGWSIAGIGDFTGDGTSDILWQNTNGTVADWIMNGSTITSEADIATVTPGSGWSIVGVGDFTGNGKSDILWQNTNGTVAEWLMSASTITSEPTIASVTHGSGWTIEQSPTSIIASI